MILFVFLISNTLIIGIYYYFRLTILFDLNLILIIVLIYLNKRLKKDKELSILSKRFIVAISTLLIIDIIGFAFIEEEYEYLGKDISLDEISILSSDTKAGYLLKDGTYSLSMRILKENREISGYESTYTINNSQRTVMNEDQNNCISMILIGGSHNFGQSIANNQTLQYSLNENGFRTINYSVPGYGLAHSYALLDERGVFEDNFNTCSNSYVIYRFIRNHINRDNGKTFFSPYSSHIIEEDISVDIQQNFKDFNTSAIYLFTKYLPTRLISYGTKQTNEVTFKILTQALQSYWFYTDADIKRSSNLLKKISSKLENKGRKSKVILLIDDNIDTIISKYLAEIEAERNISVMISPNLEEFKNWGRFNCQKMRHKEEKFIPLEGHPTGCLNKYYSKKIMKFLDDDYKGRRNENL